MPLAFFKHYSVCNDRCLAAQRNMLSLSVCSTISACKRERAKVKKVGSAFECSIAIGTDQERIKIQYSDSAMIDGLIDANGIEIGLRYTEKSRQEGSHMCLLCKRGEERENDGKT